MPSRSRDPLALAVALAVPEHLEALIPLAALGEAPRGEVLELGAGRAEIAADGAGACGRRREILDRLERAAMLAREEERLAKRVHVRLVVLRQDGELIGEEGCRAVQMLLHAVRHDRAERHAILARGRGRHRLGWHIASWEGTLLLLRVWWWWWCAARRVSSTVPLSVTYARGKGLGGGAQRGPVTEFAEGRERGWRRIYMGYGRKFSTRNMTSSGEQQSAVCGT